MGVIRTDNWLLDSYDKPINICEKLKSYFDSVSATEIYDYLALYGMYRHPIESGLSLVKKLQANNIWEIVREEERQLQKVWSGPNIPIFILPSDTNNKRLNYEYNGKSGLSFKDKLFLFISIDNEENELKALFTHEYNHICRLYNYRKDEKNYKLLDTIILEGLAENAVRERVGINSVANWTSYYSNTELEKMWENILLPNRNVSKMHLKHQSILYGLRLYPKMVGYCVGYYLVKKYMEENELPCRDLMKKSSEEIAQIKRP